MQDPDAVAKVNDSLPGNPNFSRPIRSCETRLQTQVRALDLALSPGARPRDGPVRACWSAHPGSGHRAGGCRGPSR